MIQKTSGGTKSSRSESSGSRESKNGRWKKF